MKYKKMILSSSEIITYFLSNNQEWFRIEDVYSHFLHLSQSAIKTRLKKMVNDGLLLRLKEGLYYIIPLAQDVETFMPNWNLIAEALVNSEYYVGYYSALQVHQLTTQPFFEEQIVVNKQNKPSQLVIKNIKFNFIFHNQKHFWGYKNIWIDNFHKVQCSDLEKTLIDCLFAPQKACGIVEIGKALYTARNEINFEKLLDYTNQFNSQAVIKRLGYLLEVFEIDTSIIEKLNKSRSSSIVVLDTSLPKQGKVLSRWNIIQNVDLDTLKQSILT
jgi:predicted transcriptional regulator of viral defense system